MLDAVSDARRLPLLEISLEKHADDKSTFIHEKKHADGNRIHTNLRGLRMAASAEKTTTLEYLILP